MQHKRGHLKIVQFLADRIGNLEAGDDDGWTPLHHAVDKCTLGDT